jgi:hypothetical protein
LLFSLYAPRKKKAAEPEPPPPPQVGDKVTRKGGSGTVLEISKVHHGGDEVDLNFAGTNLEWFRVNTSNLTFVERKPPAKTSNPFTNPEPTFDAGEVLERIAAIKEENLKRLDDDVDILKAYLKTQHAPKGAIEALEGLTVEQHVSWKKAWKESRSCWRCNHSVMNSTTMAHYQGGVLTR